jgi:hypothetical protein
MTDPAWDAYLKTTEAIETLMAEITRTAVERDQAVAELERCRHELAVLKAAAAHPPTAVGTHPGATRQPAPSPGVPQTNPE